MFQATRKRLWVSAALGWALASAGCPPPAGDDPNDGTNELPPSVEIGYIDEVAGTYRRVGEGEVMPLYVGFQGGSHIFVTLRATGFPTDQDGKASIVITERVTRTGTPVVLSDFSQTVLFSLNGDGVLELPSRFVFLDSPTADINDTDAVLSFTLALESDPQVAAQVTQVVRLLVPPES